MRKASPAWLLTAVAFTLGGCAQFSTNAADKTRLSAAADAAADTYIECIRTQARTVAGTTRDVAFMTESAEPRCVDQMEAYRGAQTALLATEVMLTQKPVEEAVSNLRQRSRQQLIADLQSTGAAPAAPAIGSTGPADTATAVMSPLLPANPGQWNANQRIYLDCMTAQARQYVTQTESAAVIADVVASRCRNHLGPDAGNAALLQEGRVQAMGTVLDARLEPQRR